MLGPARTRFAKPFQCPTPELKSRSVAMHAKRQQETKRTGEPKRGKTEEKGPQGSNEDLVKIAAEAKKDADTRMQKASAVLAENLNTIRTGRANPAILDRLQVDYFGVPTPLKAVAAITVPDASTLLISPFDKTAIKSIEKAIMTSEIGLNPNNDGEKIRLNVPQLTGERRKELIKQASKIGEDGKVAVRNVRKDVLKKMDKYEFPKDTKKSIEDDIQKLTDSFIKKVDELVKIKTDELEKV